MDSSHLVGEIIGLGVFGGLLIWRALKEQKKARLVQDTATSKLASAALGHTEAQGFAWPKNNKWFDSRKERRLVYYGFDLQKLVTEGSGKNRRQEWRTVYSFSFSEPFYVLDPTGLAEVDVAQAETNFANAQTVAWRNLTIKDQNYYLEKVIQQTVADFPPSNFLFGIFAKKFRVREREIACGSPLFITGHLNKKDKDIEKIQASGLTNFAKKVFNLDARSLKNVNSLLDVNGDGKISEAEMREGYCLAAQLAFHKAKKENLAEMEFELHGQFESTPDQKLFVADTHEEHLAKRISKSIYMKYASGFALIALSLVMIFHPKLFEKKPKNAYTQQNNGQLQLQIAKLRKVKLEENIPVRDLHNGCTSGNAKYCETLLEQKEKLNLTAQYIEYYQKRGCELGIQKRCMATEDLKK